MSKQKSQSGSAHLIIIIIIVLALMAALGFVFWNNFLKQKIASINPPTPGVIIPGKTASTNPPTTGIINSGNGTKASELTLDGVINLVHNQINKDYSPSGIEVAFDPANPESFTSPYRLNGIDYDIYTNKGSAITIFDSSDSKNISNHTNPILLSIKNILLHNGFNLESENTFKSKTIICSFNPNSSGSDYTGFNCGYISDYQAAATMSSPLVKAFVAANPTANIYNVGAPTNDLLNSKPGYQYATMRINSNVTSGLGLFYMKTGNDWKFFKTTTGIIQECSDYSTPELKAAYKGESCGSASGKSIVD